MRLFLVLILLVTIAFPPAIRKPNCKPFGKYPTYVCLCGKIALPLGWCEKK